MLLLHGYAQAQNLLVNPGFEEENICSEYHINCAPEGWIYTVPSFIYYFKDAAQAHTGSHYVGLIAGHSNKPYYRTFVRSRLLCALQKGNSYQLEFYLKSKHPILDSVGVYFSSYDFLFEKTVYQKIIPTLYATDAITKIDKENHGWQRIQLQFKATGNEVFITLGNFSKLPVTGEAGIDLENYFFVSFDDISLTPMNPYERLCANWKQTKEDIYDQNERHEYQERYMRVYRNNPPVVTRPATTKTIKVDTLVIPDVFFASNSFVLNAKAASLLDSFLIKMNRYKVDSAFVHGHTDSRGTEAFNQELSWQRAGSVAAYLEKKSAIKFKTIGYGSTKPVASNQTAGGRQRNRRVEIYLYLKD
jgi:outer membrane protein OmpA-like peptidoglycan-associated protein